MNKWEKENIEVLVQRFTCIADVLRYVGLPINSGNYRTFHKYRRKWNIDISHFSLRRVDEFRHPIPFEKIFVENCSHSQNALRNAVFRHNIIEYKCSKCDNSGKWQGADLSLHIDHINGINNDNRIENLRFLCPNCHQQTSTFGSKNIGTYNKCVDCNVQILKNSTRCIKCANKLKRSRNAKISWPSIEELLKMVGESSFCSVARRLGVSDNAVRKHIKNNK